MHLAQQRAVEKKIRCQQLIDHVVLAPIDGLLEEAADDCFVCFGSHASTPNATIYPSTGTRPEPAKSESINLISSGPVPLLLREVKPEPRPSPHCRAALSRGHVDG